jgi:hypothetical protein
MSVYDWLPGRAYLPGDGQIRQYHPQQRRSESALSGAVQTLSMPGSKWGWDFDFPANRNADRPGFEAFFTKLDGTEHRVRLWDFWRPRPRGSCNLAGVTIAIAAGQFARSLVLDGCGAGKTLLEGDWLGLPGGQLVMVVEGGVANGSGRMAVGVRSMLRRALAAGGAVTLDRPTALYTRTEADIALPRNPGFSQRAFSVSFIETFTA